MLSFSVNPEVNVLYHGNNDQQRLFARLQEPAQSLGAHYNCAIQGEGEHMTVLLSDWVTHGEAWVSAGSPDFIVAAFEKWVEEPRKPRG